MSCRFEDSFRAGPGLSCSKAVFKPVWNIPVSSVQFINSWWWAEELPETCRVSCRSKFGKLVNLVGFVIKKFVTMHDHMNVLLRCTVTWTYCYDAPSHERIVTMHVHMNVLLRCTDTWTYCYDARSHERIVTMHGHMNVLLRCTVTWTYCYDARSHERIVTMHRHMNVLLRCTVTWTYCYDARSHERKIGWILYLQAICGTSPSDLRHPHSTRESALWYLCYVASNIWVTVRVMVWKGCGTQRMCPILLNVQVFGLGRKNYKLTQVLCGISKPRLEN
jgi:hypothetical protein